MSKRIVKNISGIKEFNLDKYGEFINKISPVKLQMFLRSTLSGEINNKNDAMEEYSKNIDNDYSLLLKPKSARKGGNRDKLKIYMNTAKHIIFGQDSPLKSDSTDSENETLNIGQGETEDIGDPPPLETEEEAAKRQKRKGLKIMTPKQMIVRLPILLAQSKAGNNSQKLKNEIRQIAYSLYRSNNLSKTIYNNLINTI